MGTKRKRAVTSLIQIPALCRRLATCPLSARSASRRRPRLCRRAAVVLPACWIFRIAFSPSGKSEYEFAPVVVVTTAPTLSHNSLTSTRTYLRYSCLWRWKPKRAGCLRCCALARAPSCRLTSCLSKFGTKRKKTFVFLSKFGAASASEFSGQSPGASRLDSLSSS